jgi:NADPH:quinone reductase-like Zn-dependent oxidoreductase
MMRSLAIEEYCIPDDYQILCLPIPKVSAPDDVLIKVHGASINPIDVKIASGAAKFVSNVSSSSCSSVGDTAFPLQYSVDILGNDSIMLKIPVQDRL